MLILYLKNDQSLCINHNVIGWLNDALVNFHVIGWLNKTCVNIHLIDWLNDTFVKYNFIGWLRLVSHNSYCRLVVVAVRVQDVRGHMIMWPSWGTGHSKFLQMLHEYLKAHIICQYCCCTILETQKTFINLCWWSPIPLGQN